MHDVLGRKSFFRLSCGRQRLQKLQFRKLTNDLELLRLLFKDLPRPFSSESTHKLYCKIDIFMRLFSLKGIHRLSALPQKCIHRSLFMKLMKRCKEKTNPVI